MLRINLIIVLSLMLLGCETTTPPVTMGFSPSVNTHIQSIEIRTLREVDQIEVEIFDHPAAGLGLVGVAVTVADQHEKTKSLNGALASKPDWRQLTLSALSQALNEAGYQIQTAAEVDAGNNASTSTADAILGIEILPKFVAAGPTTDYIPTVLATVQLHDKNNKLLYEKRLIAGISGIYEDREQLSGDPATFSDIYALTERAPEALGAIEANLKVVAEAIARDLRKAPN